MSSTQDARGILADAEKALRELMQREIDEHRYGEIAEVARLADGLARLLRGAPAPAPATRPRKGAPLKQRKANSARRGPAPAKAKNYPRFERDGARLIKVGWSKKAREEYEHRAPRNAVAAFVSHLISRVEPGKTFVMEDLFPVPDDAGDEVPAYQAYLTLALLRDLGAIEKKGRDGYVVVPGQIETAEFNSLWERIPERS